ncbi:MAG: TolC family protein, partial [Dysgonamonadaceae bacterium]|nr:TolC family protein [Dysgonamonadaceae bacterium]
MKNKLKILLLLISLTGTNIHSQTIKLTLSESIELAIDSSLQAFRAKNQYMANYWAYISYKAGRLPSLTLRTTPLEYRSDFTRRYDSNANIDVY